MQPPQRKTNGISGQSGTNPNLHRSAAVTSSNNTPRVKSGYTYIEIFQNAKYIFQIINTFKYLRRKKYHLTHQTDTTNEVRKIEEEVIFKKVDAKDIWKLPINYRHVGVTQSDKIPKYEIDAMYNAEKNFLYGYKLTPYEDFFDNLGEVLSGSKSPQSKQELYYVFEKKEEL